MTNNDNNNNNNNKTKNNSNKNDNTNNNNHHNIKINNKITFLGCDSIEINLVWTSISGTAVTPVLLEL